VEPIQEHKEGSAIVLEGDLPGGVHAKASFRDRVSVTEVLLLLLIALQSVSVYYMNQQDGDRENRYAGLTKVMGQLVTQVAEISATNKSDHAQVFIYEKAAAAEQRVQTYVLTLDDKARKALNLQEPEELRARRR